MINFFDQKLKLDLSGEKIILPLKHHAINGGIDAD